MTQPMSPEPERHPGFGVRLRDAREAAGLTLEEVSRRLHMPMRVLRSLENDDWGVLGAPVFVRGQLRSYARFLGVSLPGEVTQVITAVAPPAALVSRTYTPRYRRLAEQAMRRGVYIVLTVALAAPVLITARSHLSGDLAPAQSLEPLLAPEKVQAGAAPSEPVVASLTALPEPPASPAGNPLELRFAGDSWVEVFGRDGRILEKGIIVAGQSRRFEADQVGRIVLGNSAAVDVQLGNARMDLAPFSRANVARFALSSNGSLTPVLD